MEFLALVAEEDVGSDRLRDWHSEVDVSDRQILILHLTRLSVIVLAMEA